jgi:hypothetical protein
MDKKLSEVTPEDIEDARKLIEDQLVWMRDDHVYLVREGTYVGNGLVIRNKDGSESSVIRLRVNEAIEMAINAIMKKES